MQHDACLMDSILHYLGLRMVASQVGYLKIRQCCDVTEYFVRGSSFVRLVLAVFFSAFDTNQLL